MSRNVNRNQISEPTKCSPQLSTSPSAYCSVSSSTHQTPPQANSPTLNNGPNEVIRRGSQCNPMFKPNELLQGYSDDMNMLRPLLMYNLENIQTYRADCRFKRARHN